MAKCYTCGTIYNGSSCPTCSLKEKLEQTTKEQTEALEDSLREQERMLEEQRESMEYAFREAEAEHKKTTSEAWKLQAEAKTKRASELHKAGLYEEATKLCLDAISQDPGNIMPYFLATQSFKKIGQDIKVRELLKKQIRLLKTSDYKKYIWLALLIIEEIIELKNNENLMQSFIETSKDFDNNIKFLGIVCAIELININTTDLHIYLENQPYTERNSMFEILKEIKNKGLFSAKTIKLVQGEILKRYEGWKPEIKSEFRKTAEIEAKVKAGNDSTPTCIAWVAGVASIFIWVPISQATQATSEFLMILFGLGGPIATGIFTSRFVRSIKRDNIENELIISMEKKEKENLGTIL